MMKINISRNVLILAVFFLILVLSLLFCLRKVLVRPKQPALAKVAIVIDDWGYNLDNLSLLKDIAQPITVSILPNLRYSSKIAAAAEDLGQETILHLPLEPELQDRDYIGLEKNTITTQMSEEEVIANLQTALLSLSKVSGISNHMGSRATQDSRLMAVIFAELKKRKLFFLDNLVSPKSICPELAREMGVKFGCRDIFLDNSNDPAYIKGQLKKLTGLALKTGQAVGIGHARYNTLKTIQDEIPLMQARGIEFVFASDLIQ